MKLQNAHQSICTDPRDRVYALLSIHAQGSPPGSRKLDIVPNYGDTVSQAYQQATLEVINSAQQKIVLKVCELRPNKFHSLPSWVPDFSRHHSAPPLSSSHAAGSTYPEWKYRANGILCVQGRSVCTLEMTEACSRVEQACFPVEQTDVGMLRVVRQMRASMGFGGP